MDEESALALGASEVVESRERLNLLMLLEKNKPSGYSLGDLMDAVNAVRASNSEDPISMAFVRRHLAVLEENECLISKFDAATGRKVYTGNDKGQHLLDWMGFTKEKIRRTAEKRR